MSAFQKLKTKLFGSGESKIKSDNMLNEEKIAETKRKTKQIILVGTGNSGKTTIYKQLRKEYNDLDEMDIKIIQNYIQDAVVGYMKLLCYQSQILHEQYNENTIVDDSLQEIRSQFLSLSSPCTLTKDIAAKIETLWSDRGIKETLNKRHHYQIADSVEYFFNRINIISQENYTPNYEDFLRIRTRSTGFSTTKCIENIDKFGEYVFQVMDVAGARSCRRKWFQYLSQMDAFLYVVALSDYDLQLFEDNKTNRLVEAINLFSTIAQKRFFENKSLWILLNKYDIFREKIKRIPITVSLIDYPINSLDPNDELNVVQFIAGKFLKCLEDEDIVLGPLHILRTNAITMAGIDIHSIFKHVLVDDDIRKNPDKYPDKMELFVHGYVNEIKHLGLIVPIDIIPIDIIQLLFHYVDLSCKSCFYI